MHKTFEHKADIGIIGKGKTLEKAFEEAAKAMFSIQCNIKKVKQDKKIRILASASNKEELFVEFLNQLLTQSSLKDMLFSKFKVKIKENEVKGYAIGEKIQKKHQLKTEIKAATYSELKVFQEKSSWVVQCIIDV